MKKYLILLIAGFLFQNDLLASGNNFYAFSKLDYYTRETKGTIIVSMSGGKTQKGISIELYLKGKLLTSGQYSGSSLIKIPFDIQKVPAGSSEITCKILQNGQAIASLPVKILRLPPKDNEVKVNRLTGGLIVNGLPFYPFGFYCGSPVGTLSDDEVVYGFNMIAPYQKNTPETFAERKAYMDRCAQLGIKVHYALNGLIGEPHNKSRKNPLTQEERFEIFKKEIIAFRDHPALLAWYINDEPLGQSRPVALLEKAYKMVKELDPYHPASIVFMMPHRANEFGNAIDIAMTDPYPIPAGPDMVRQHVLDLKRHFEYRKSIWLVPQAFGGGEFWTRGPTRGEIRVMTYTGIVEGAKGIQYFIRRPPNLSPKATDAWSTCRDMAIETAEMTPYLLSEEPSPTMEADQQNVLTHAWRYRGKILVVAVNMNNQPTSVNLSFPGLKLNTKGRAMFENREVEVHDGQIRDYITAFGTLAFLIDEKEVDEKIRIEPANLILNPSFEDNASSGTPGECTARYDTDRGDPGATYFIDNCQAVHGTHSLRLVSPVDSGGIALNFYHIDLQAGRSYTMSIWGRAEKRPEMPAFEMAIDKVPAGDIFTLSPEWKKYSVPFEVTDPPGRPSVRLVLHTAGTGWFDLLEVAPDPDIRYEITEDGRAVVSIKTVTANVDIRYTTDGKTPEKYSRLFMEPFVLKKAATVTAALFMEGQRIVQSSVFIPVNKALNKTVQYKIPFSPKYAAGGEKALTDGKLAGSYFKDKNWQGFDGTDIDVVIDLGKEIALHSVSAEFLSSVNDGIHLPKAIIVELSKDGSTFEPAGQIKNDEHGTAGKAYKKTFTIKTGGKKGRYIRFNAKTVGLIPEGYLFKGTKSWLFIDEILAE